jgi:hypothetical protein
VDLIVMDERELAALRKQANDLLNSRDYYYLLDENKHPYKCTLGEWGEWFQNSRGDDKRRVAEDEINGKRISTVFLGMDHNLYGEGRPLIFETMVFDEKGNDIWMDRYSTWNDSEIGHEKAKEWVKNGCKDE